MDRLTKLRSFMKTYDCDAYLITDSDCHYTFYSLLQDDRRINWITGSQAQCGLALVTQNDGAAFQVSPSYRFLAKTEVQQNLWSIVDNIAEWLCERNTVLKNIGYDPRYTPLFIFSQLSKYYSLCPILSSLNFIDAISNSETTSDRKHLTPIWKIDQNKFIGESAEYKIRKLRENYLTEDDVKNYTFITSAMDEIAWLLNLRGNDMPCNPLFFSFMVVSNDQLVLFTDNTHQISEYDIRNYHEFYEFISTLKSENIWVDERISMSVINALDQPPHKISRSPIQQLKEIKNPIELDGFRQCHYRDCAAVCQTFAWLQQAIDNDVEVSEISVAKFLEERQKEQNYFIGIAFDTISAVGSNTALVEYSPRHDRSEILVNRDLYYLDAGANYLDGTTDMTRTLHFGQPAQKQIECYTLALRGILAVEMAQFDIDETITGCRIYSILKQYFNEHHYSTQHVSFGHGVSHGHGVIEGGVSISDNHCAASNIPIRPGMVLALEPGVYFEEEWGVRIENVYAVETFDNGSMHFVPLTLIPYSRKLIDFSLLTQQELNWIDNYHNRCLEKINGESWMKSEIDQFRMLQVSYHNLDTVKTVDVQ